METLPEKERCSGCAKMRLVEMFGEGQKNCVKCAEKRRRQKHNNYEYIIELERQIKTIKTKKKPERADKDFAEQ